MCVKDWMKSLPSLFYLIIMWDNNKKSCSFYVYFLSWKLKSYDVYFSIFIASSASLVLVWKLLICFCSIFFFFFFSVYASALSTLHLSICVCAHHTLPDCKIVEHTFSIKYDLTFHKIKWKSSLMHAFTYDALCI